MHIYRSVRLKIQKLMTTLVPESYPRPFHPPSHGAYTPFIILGQARTGSNLLRVALESSPQVRMANEIFSSQERVFGKDYEIILANLLRHYPSSVKAVGCKIFYSHLTNDEWMHLQSLRNFKIIHLMRRNALRTFLSLQIAQKNHTWLESKSARKLPLEQRQIWIDQKQLKAFIQLRLMWREQARQRFKEHETLELYYEDLVADFERVVTTAITFIGAETWDSQKVYLRKQNPESMRELILNYDELKRAFANTPMQVYFDEV